MSRSFFQNDVVPVPRNTSYDSDEDDPELRVLRETALASRRTIIPTSPTEVTKPPSMTTAVPLKSASSNKPVNGAVKDVRDQPSRQIQRERPEQVQPRQERNSYSSRQSSHNQSNISKSQPRSKYDDLDLEDLRQRYHASKRKSPFFLHQFTENVCMLSKRKTNAAFSPVQYSQKPRHSHECELESMLSSLELFSLGGEAPLDQPLFSF